MLANGHLSTQNAYRLTTVLFPPLGAVKVSVPDPGLKSPDPAILAPTTMLALPTAMPAMVSVCERGAPVVMAQRALPPASNLTMAIPASAGSRVSPGKNAVGLPGAATAIAPSSEVG